MIGVERPHFTERAEKHLEGITDLTLLILKTHLLLEEALYEAVSAKCAKPEFLIKARLSFHQQLLLMKALYAAPKDDPKRAQQMAMFWDAAEALNALRNKCAHALEPQDLESLLQRLHIQDIREAKSLSDPKILNALSNTACILIGFAWGLASLFKEDPDTQIAITTPR